MTEENNSSYHSGGADPMNDDMYKIILTISQSSKDLIRFLYERSELYGIVLNLLLDKGVYEYEMKYDDMRSVRNYMLVIQPDNETETLKLKVIVNKDIPMQED